MKNTRPQNVVESSEVILVRGIAPRSCTLLGPALVFLLVGRHILQCVHTPRVGSTGHGAPAHGREPKDTNQDNRSSKR